MTHSQRLLRIRDDCVSMLARAQTIRIQQVQATNQLYWPSNMKKKANVAWSEMNQLSESVEAELAKLAAELETGDKS